MKKSFLLTVVCMACAICNAQENGASEPESRTQPSEPKETVAFDKSEHDFGVISESGGIVECEFTLENKGDTPLIIQKVTPSCGCTAADYTKEPIAPGKKGFVKATFNPGGNKNVFTKTITVYTNANPSRKSLTITGEIK